MSNDTSNTTTLRAEAEAAEAATLWRDAADAYERCLSEGPLAPDEEIALLTALGRCYWNMAEARSGWRTLRRAITMAEERGDGVAQARATVELLRIWGPPERQRTFAENALAALGDGDPRLRALLLFRLRWFDEDPDVKFEEAMTLAERHGIDDVLVVRTEREAWRAFEEGRVDESLRLFEQVHGTYARLRMYDWAASTLRNVSFNILEYGSIDQGAALSLRCADYARDVHLGFSEQLALTDLAGVHYARGERDQMTAVLGRMPGMTDFRADLYRAWSALDDGDPAAALRLMPPPDVAGGATTAVSQLHIAAAGILHAAGKGDAARTELQAWYDVSSQQFDDLAQEAAAGLDVIVALGDERIWRGIHESFRKTDERFKAGSRYSTLQGRARAPVRAAVAFALGLRDEAASIYRDGVAWCERERLTRDAEVCREGLAAATA